jgi:hypothetical protein
MPSLDTNQPNPRETGENGGNGPGFAVDALGIRLFSVDDLALALGQDRRWVYRQHEERGLPGLKLGPLARVPTAGGAWLARGPSCRRLGRPAVDGRREHTRQVAWLRGFASGTRTDARPPDRDARREGDRVGVVFGSDASRPPGRLGDAGRGGKR